MSELDYVRLVAELFGAGVVLSSGQWLVSVNRLRLDLLLGWSRTARVRVTSWLLLRLSAGLCLVATDAAPVMTAASAIILLSNMAIWRPMRPALHAVFRVSHLLAAIFLVRALAGPGEIDGAVLVAVAGVSALSYLVTGAAKLVSPRWRDGRILLVALKSRTNGCRPLYLWMRDRPLVLRATVWSVILFECLFPVSILAGYSTAVLFCVLGGVFHVAVAITMGMNLFLLIWGATYPAVLFAAAHVNQLPSFFDVQSGWTLVLAGWMAALGVWQLVAWIPGVRRRRRNERAFYLALYEFYMFAVRSADDGLQYRVIAPAGADAGPPEWRPFPLPWNRRWHDWIWNPEHELKKALRHAAREIRLARNLDSHAAAHLREWLRRVERCPTGSRLELRVLEEDSYDAASLPAQGAAAGISGDYSSAYRLAAARSSRSCAAVRRGP